MKIGRSKQPKLRFATLITGIPFRSTMLYAPVRTRGRSVKLETTLHRDLENFNTRGEWFRFKGEQKSEFHRITKARYLESEGEPLGWLRVSDQTAATFAEMMSKTKAVRHDYGSHNWAYNPSHDVGRHRPFDKILDVL